MNDYQVNMTELAAYAETLKGIGGDIAEALAAPSLSGIAAGMRGGVAAQVAELQVVPAWESSVAAATSHQESHSSTLAEIARAYQANEDDAKTRIRGFYEGRVT